MTLAEQKKMMIITTTTIEKTNSALSLCHFNGTQEQKGQRKEGSKKGKNEERKKKRGNEGTKARRNKETKERCIFFTNFATPRPMITN